MTIDERASTADLAGEHLLAPDATERFEREGFVRVPRVLDPDTVAAFAPTVTEVAAQSAQVKVPEAQRSVYQRAFVQEVNLWQRIEAIRPLVFSAKLAQVAAELMAVDGVRLYHDQALVKVAHGGRTPWHCDQYYWPIDTDRTVTVWIPLHDVPAEMGPLSFAVGSHRLDLGRELDISDESERRIFAHPDWRDLPIDEAPALAGDVTFHQGWTFHGASSNDTDEPRVVFTMIYFADGATLLDPQTPGQNFDRSIWLPDSVVGEPLASWLSPLVWSRDGAPRSTLPPVDDRIGTFTPR